MSLLVGATRWRPYPATAYPATAYPATAYPATAYPATAYSDVEQRSSRRQPQRKPTILVSRRRHEGRLHVVARETPAMPHGHIGTDDGRSPETRDALNVDARQRLIVATQLTE